MRSLTRVFCQIIITLTCCGMVYAEDGVLVLQVSNPKGQPITGVVLSTKGDGSTGPATSSEGKTRIVLAPQTKSNTEVSLQIVKAPTEMMFISPWDGRVRVPPFENESQNFVPVILIEPGDRAWLEYGVVTLALLSKINAANASAPSNGKTPEEQRTANLEEVAKLYGVTPADIDRAIRSFGAKATGAYEKGQVALYEENYPEAEKQFLISKEERKKDYEKALNEYADVNFSLGQTYYKQGKYTDAVEAYRAAAGLRPTDSKTLSALAGALEITGNSGEVEGLLKRALALDEKEFGPNDPKVVNRVWDLGAYYANHNIFEKCESHFKRVISILETNFGGDYPTLAYHFNNLAMLYMTRGDRNTEVEALLKRGLTIQEKAFGADDPRVAYSLNTLGVFYYSQGKEAEAEQTIKKGLGIIIKAIRTSTDPKSDATDLATNFITGASYLSSLYIKQKKYAEAEKYLEVRARLSETSEGSMNPRLVKSLDDLADVYQRQKKYAEAETLYKRSLSIMENALGKEHVQLAEPIYNLASLYEEQGNYPAAEANFKRVETIYEKAAGVKPSELATITLNLADFYTRRKNYVEAEMLLNRVTALVEKSDEPRYPNAAAILSRIADLYAQQEKNDRAEELFKKVLTIIDGAQSPKYSDQLVALGNLGDFFAARKKYPEAEQIFKRLLTLIEAQQGSNDRNTGVAALKLAEIYREQDKYVDAKLQFERAIKIFEVSYGPEHPAVAEALDGYAALLRKMNQTSEAEKYEARAKRIREKQPEVPPHN